VIAAMEQAAGKGAVALDGRMIDRPHVRQAERILAAALTPALTPALSGEAGEGAGSASGGVPPRQPR
jgi:hypothetical protein